ncbi:hypothetical protein N7462_011633, partial [Penicillium macrosclerotiorum]|uniref:uncharacterized protein n=1 Tax=Penicillium macrosclerotiorum TaxID=303699 RepID=UPI0025466308
RNAYSTPSSREDFKIAIICALTLEAKAVLPLLETTYDDSLHIEYGKVPSDPNAYTLGSAEKYHVVIVHMPGQGKGFASSVASNIKRSYPNIELALVVGVCGGVPNGVVQHDLGKRVPGKFVRKNTVPANLGRRSPQILAFLNKLDVGYKRLTSRLASYLVKVQEDFQSEYPGVTKDKLFSPDYKHKSTNCRCDQAICHDDNNIVRLRAYDQSDPRIQVHFGLMASGDTLMTSAKDRDRIAKTENVIGFEMEGAGVWDNLPCIVIKGVSDYADSHKSKEWQHYATASAAACMRAILDEIPVSLSASATESV